MSKRTRDWIVAISYVAAIFATLQVVGIPLSYLRSHGVLRLTISILFLICIGIGLRFLLRNHPRSPTRLLAFALLGILIYRLAHSIKIPEEQMHFFEYGLVGIFFHRALRHDVRNRAMLWLGAWTLASLSGWCDEFLQGLTPTRHYDIRDVGLNIIAAFLGLTAYLICKKTDSTR